MSVFFINIIIKSIMKPFSYVLRLVKLTRTRLAFVVLSVCLFSYLHFLLLPSIHGAYNEECYLSEKKRNELRHLILVSAQLLEKYNRTYWLDFGILLGCVKYGDVLPWDGDADISFLRDNTFNSDALNEEFLKYGISRNALVATVNNTQLDYYRWQETQGTWDNEQTQILKVYYPKRITDSDNFLVKYEHKREQIPLSWVIPTRKLLFHGQHVSVPNNYEDVLKARYPLTYQYTSIYTPYKWKCWVPCWLQNNNRCREYQ